MVPTYDAQIKQYGVGELLGATVEDQHAMNHARKAIGILEKNLTKAQQNYIYLPEKTVGLSKKKVSLSGRVSHMGRFTLRRTKYPRSLLALRGLRFFLQDVLRWRSGIALWKTMKEFATQTAVQMFDISSLDPI